MKAWQQRLILYTLLVLVGTTLIGLKANIPFFMQMTSSLGISNTAFVEEVSTPAISTPAIDSFKTPGFLALKAKATKGDAEAALQVARTYKMAPNGDIKTANDWYIKAAEAGQAYAQYYIASNYFYGTEGLPTDKKKAKYWSEKAANQGDSVAQLAIGIIYENENNYKKAIFWYEKAIAQGNYEAMGNMASLYYNGNGVTKDFKKGFALRKKSADAGVKEAQYELGYDFLAGEDGTLQDYKQAKQYLEKSALQGMPNAQYCLGWLYDYALGVDPDKQIAKHWYEKAIANGSEEAQTALDAMLKDGLHGKKMDVTAIKTFEGLLQKAEKTQASEDQYAVANAYGWGKGVAKSYQKSYEWLEKAAKQGHVQSIGSLGDYWYDGLGGTVDFKKAIVFYEQAAAKGEKWNQNRLGYMYDAGEGTAIDKKKAVYWYKKSAEQGYDVAQINLGIQYEYGEGIGTNPEQALYWYYMAAKQGNSDAMRRVGHMHEYGQGIVQSKEKAYFWYEKSAMAGGRKEKEAMANRYFGDARRGPTKFIQGGYWLMLSSFDLIKEAEASKS